MQTQTQTQTYTHIITPAQLTPLIDRAQDTVVFDCRHDLAQPAWGQAQYAVSHIPAAQFACLDRDLSGLKAGRNGRHPLPDRDAFIAFLASRGASPDTQIIAYDQGDGMYAARLWWLCRWAGLSCVAVLEGGLAAWLGQGGAIAQEIATPQGKASWQLPALETVVTAQTVLDNLDHPQFVVVDARAPQRYRGEIEPLDPVAGHIPMALNHVFKRNVDAQGLFATDVAQQWQATRLAAGGLPLVHSCGSGVTACHNILAQHVAGLTQANEASRLYAGSWSEWCSDPTRPVAVG